MLVNKRREPAVGTAPFLGRFHVSQGYLENTCRAVFWGHVFDKVSTVLCLCLVPLYCFLKDHTFQHFVSLNLIENSYGIYLKLKTQEKSENFFLNLCFMQKNTTTFLIKLKITEVVFFLLMQKLSIPNLKIWTVSKSKTLWAGGTWWILGHAENGLWIMDAQLVTINHILFGDTIWETTVYSIKAFTAVLSERYQTYLMKTTTWWSLFQGDGQPPKF